MMKVVANEDVREVTNLLGRLQTPQPDVRHSARVRAKYLAALEQEASSRSVFPAVLVGAVSLVYFSTVLIITVRVSGFF